MSDRSRPLSVSASWLSYLRPRPTLWNAGWCTADRCGDGGQCVLPAGGVQDVGRLRSADSDLAVSAERRVRDADLEVLRVIDYFVSVLTLIAIFAIVALALNVRWGWAGEFDFFVYGLLAVGAYVYAVVTLPPAPKDDPGFIYMLGLKQ